MKISSSTPSAPGIQFRPARRAELDVLVAMLADDELGSQREVVRSPLPAEYVAAFDAIDSDPNQELVVAESHGDPVGLLQLTFIPSLTYRGSWRVQVEGVRVSRNHRGQGIGRGLLLYAIDRARSRDCVMVQLTSDKRRPDAIAFYEELGFEASHEGFKLRLQ